MLELPLAATEVRLALRRRLDTGVLRLRASWRHGAGLRRAVLVGLLVYLVARPGLALVHELAVLGLAELLCAAVGRVIEWDALRLLPLDPVYTRAGLGYLVGARTVGIAVAGPLGSWLHGQFGGPWLAPELTAPGAGVSAVFEPGSTLLGRAVAVFAADVAVLAAGLALAASRTPRRPWLVVFGSLMQAHIVVGHLWRSPLSVDAIEAMGVPFAVASVVARLGGTQSWFTGALGALGSPWRELIVAGTATALAYAAAWTLLVVVRRLPRPWRRANRPGRPTRPEATPRVGTAAPRVAALGLAAALAWSPLATLAEAESSLLAHDPLANRDAAVAAVAEEPAEVSTGGSLVWIESVPNGGFRYVVNGRPRVLRGMGYNPHYSGLDPAERRARYDRDFAAMRAAGVNTIEGWFESEFDEVTLDAAAAQGIGVIMPFELNQDLDYTDPAVRERLTSELLAIVARYRSHPAVRMWGPGNENLHRILFPNWVSRVGDPRAEARAATFASFYVELIDKVRAADPNHPVIYRDAEEVYLARLKTALAQRPAARPWLVYGANIYSSRLDTILKEWPTHGLGTPLVVSEFAPSGVAPADRPARFRQIWTTIRRYPDWVFGGLVYTWSTQGPEELDRVFGIVDPDGRARDGSLSAIGDMYRAGRIVTDAMR